MTIAIGASGNNAGIAIFKGLQAAEAVAEGAIGGFAVFVVLTQDREIVRFETQRGGARTLFTEGEQTGVEPPDVVRGAIAAALISSGPDRPHPLSQFLAADAQAGLVTGHRVPQGPSVAGVPLNVDVLNQLRAGRSAAEATKAVLSQNPHADVGFITIDLNGNLVAQNSEKVKTRPDLGFAEHYYSATPDIIATVAVLHNAIEPHNSLAPLVADIALRQMLIEKPIAGWITVPAGIPLQYGEVDAVEVDDKGMAQCIFTTDPTFLQGERSGVAIYLHSLVKQNGRILGKTLFEPICTVQAGVLASLNGKAQMQISYASEGITDAF